MMMVLVSNFLNMDYISFKGKKIPVKFAYRTIKNIKDQHGVDMTSQKDIQEWLTQLEKQEILFFEMIKTGYFAEEKENPYTINDMVAILSEDHAYADFLKIYQKCGVEFITPSSPKGEATESKKK